jgi:hypothetical protein
LQSTSKLVLSSLQQRGCSLPFQLLFSWAGLRIGSCLSTTSCLRHNKLATGPKTTGSAVGALICMRGWAVVGAEHAGPITPTTMIGSNRVGPTAEQDYRMTHRHIVLSLSLYVLQCYLTGTARLATNRTWQNPLFLTSSRQLGYNHLSFC